MNHWCWLLLAMLMLPAGCAPGYYEKGAASGDAAPGYYETKTFYQNPETEEEYRMRIWYEESRR